MAYQIWERGVGVELNANPIDFAVAPRAGELLEWFEGGKQTLYRIADVVHAVRSGAEGADDDYDICKLVVDPINPLDRGY